MRILIIEDEKPAAQRITKLVQALDKTIEIIEVIDSVEDAVAWFKGNEMPDLAFMDIQLADGLSFNIFKEVEVSSPVIFTTAYDEYALEAFKVNSIDYLLKPIDPKALDRAWEKYQSLKGKPNNDILGLIETFKTQTEQKKYKERFLVKKGDGFKYLTANEAAYFYADGGLTFMISQAGDRHIVDDKMDKLETSLNPKNFFRVNRKLIINERSVGEIANYFNSRLKLSLKPKFDEDVIVARDRVSRFKNWLGE